MVRVRGQVATVREVVCLTRGKSKLLQTGQGFWINIVVEHQVGDGTGLGCIMSLVWSTSRPTLVMESAGGTGH